MTQPGEITALYDIYGDLPISDEEFEAVVMRSLNPRGPEMLLDALAEHGLTAADRLLDAGCRDSAHDETIVRRFGCSVFGIDLVLDNVRRGRALIDEASLTGQIEVAVARIEALPAPSEAFTFIWCRDVLSHIPDLAAAFREFARVLEPGGRMLIYSTFATDLLEPNEAQRLFQPLAISPVSMSAAAVEAAYEQAGFRTLVRDEIGSEWREWWEESGKHTTAKQLLKIAHLRRDRDRLIAELGERSYAVELADCHWGVYQMLGKLCPTMIVLEKPVS